MNEFINSRPQELCLMCGKCCKIVTGAKPYQELKKMASEGDKGAIDFLDIFEPYASVDAARDVCPKTVDNIIHRYNEFNSGDITFYRCKYLLEDNSCGGYEKRPDLCKCFPSSCWAVVPPGCGYEGWLFNEREKVKYKIRQLKESIVELKSDLKTASNDQIREKIELAIQKSESIVNVYLPYGANDW